MDGAHGLVEVHGVKGWGVESGQPHVADDDDLEGIVGVTEAVVQSFAAGLGSNVLLPVLRVWGRAGHYDFDPALIVYFAIPLGAELYDLVVAVDAGCFSMSLARRLSAAGYSPESIHTEARVRFGRSGEGYAISRIDLRTEAEIPGVDEDLFLEKAEAAKRDCAVSKALAGVEEIRQEAKLVEHAG
jgi:osmotically inducible protein OsmC